MLIVYARHLRCNIKQIGNVYVKKRQQYNEKDVHYLLYRYNMNLIALNIDK